MHETQRITAATLAPRSKCCAGRTLRGLALVTGFVLSLTLAAPQGAWAQPAGAHSLYPNPTYAPAGSVGQLQRFRSEVVACDGFQPVKIMGAPWLLVAWADHGTFVNLHQAPLTLGLKVAPVYRFKVMGLPGNDTAEIYPTVEVIDRLHPPAGQEAKFPIPIEITPEDLRLALGGQFVTRVIYVEDPDQALPYVSDPDKTSWFDAGSKANPLAEADRLGRPVAILRIGGRQPDPVQGPDMTFLGGCPPLVIYGFSNSTFTVANQTAVPNTTTPMRTAPSAPPVGTPSPRDVLNGVAPQSVTPGGLVPKVGQPLTAEGAEPMTFVRPQFRGAEVSRRD